MLLAGRSSEKRLAYNMQICIAEILLTKFIILQAMPDVFPEAQDLHTTSGGPPDKKRRE